MAIQGELLAKVLLRIERILTGEEMLPLFGDGEYADAESSDRAGIREGEEIGRIVDGIKKNDFHRHRVLTVRRKRGLKPREPREHAAAEYMAPHTDMQR